MYQDKKLTLYIKDRYCFISIYIRNDWDIGRSSGGNLELNIAAVFKSHYVALIKISLVQTLRFQLHAHFVLSPHE